MKLLLEAEKCHVHKLGPFANTS